MMYQGVNVEGLEAYHQSRDSISAFSKHMERWITHGRRRLHNG